LLLALLEPLVLAELALPPPPPPPPHPALMTDVIASATKPPRRTHFPRSTFI
jgi:hypothetical protein